jgi:hypothetical protein
MSGDGNLEDDKLFTEAVMSILAFSMMRFVT